VVNKWVSYKRVYFESRRFSTNDNHTRLGFHQAISSAIENCSLPIVYTPNIQDTLPINDRQNITVPDQNIPWSNIRVSEDRSILLLGHGFNYWPMLSVRLEDAEGSMTKTSVEFTNSGKGNKGTTIQKKSAVKDAVTVRNLNVTSKRP